MAGKQLIIAVEGTAAVGPHWKTIISDYLEKIVRSFSGNDSIGQKPPALSLRLGLVVFYTHGSYNACLVQRSGWTRDIDIFFQWLSALSFCGGGFNDAAIAEGLSEALMMLCPLKANQTQQNVEGQRHCILVAASNPYSLPTPVYRPRLQKMEQTECTEAQTDDRLSDAETIAKCFGPCSVSLSVICPKQLPKLKAIFNAGKCNLRTDLPVDIAKNPSFLVLISENLMEGGNALSRPGMQNVAVTQSPVKVDTNLAQPVSGPLSTSIPTANGSVRPVTVGNIPPVTVKVEPPTVTSTAGPVFPHMSSVPRPAIPAVATLQTSSPISSKDMMSPPESVQDMKPIVSSMTQTMRPAGPAAANVRILNDVARQALAGSSSIGLQSMGGTPMLSNMISSGMGSSVPAAQSVLSSSQSALTSIATSNMPLTGSVQPSQSSGPATSNISQNSNPNMPQTMNNLQSSVNMGQSVPAMNPSTLPSSTQMGQNGINISQSMLSGMGTSGMPSASGAMMPTPGMSQPQQTGMQLGVSDSTAVNMSLSQQNSVTLQSAQSKYVKVWEGNLSGQRQGQPVFITRLEGYRSAAASESLAANWPETMQIVRLISQDHMNNKQYVGKADFLVFRAMNQHGFLGQLQEKKLCAVIQLPSQTLLLSVSDKACRLIGMLFPGDMVVFKPQISTQQHQQQQMQHQQPQQQLQVQPHQQLQQQPQQPHQQLQQQQQSMPQLQHQPHLSQLQQQQPQQQQSQQLNQFQQQQQPMSHMQQQQQQPLMQLQQQQQIPQLQQQQQQQMPQLSQQQQMPQLPQQQQQQQMVGTTMGQTYMQGPGRSPLMSQGQGASNINGGSFMN